jgi:crotonobetainyl-CoA:carnitine CoA-transferase CaiB-like acyl-CoA transferase
VPGALEGIRVLDFGRYIAGPYCAALLGELGAEVIRIERRAGSEDRFLAPITEGGDGALFVACNRGKLGITLDPAHPEGREVTRRLVRTADVVVANVPLSGLAALGIDYPALQALRPEIILTFIDAFGAGGPYSGRVGFDGVGQAMSGALWLSGTPGHPAKSVANYVDYTTAFSAAFATLGALLVRERTGKGQLVEASLLGSALTLMGSTLLEEAALGLGRVGTGNRSQLSGPSDTFATKDGFVLVQTVGDPLFRRWVEMIGEPAWATDPRFATDALRGRNGAVLSERMQQWCAERTTAEALSALERARIPAGPVYSPRETIGDPHVRAGFLETVPGLGSEARAPRRPFRMQAGAASGPRAAPRLGEHTEAILAELGYGPAEIAALRRSGAI